MRVDKIGLTGGNYEKNLIVSECGEAEGDRPPDEISRVWQRQLEKLGQKSLKGFCFLLLQNYDALPPSRESRLDDLLEINEPLALCPCVGRAIPIIMELVA